MVVILEDEIKSLESKAKRLRELVEDPKNGLNLKDSISVTHRKDWYSQYMWTNKKTGRKERRTIC